MTRLISVVLLSLLAGCGGITPGPKPPQPPPAYQFTVKVYDEAARFVPGAEFVVDGQSRGTTNANGFAGTLLPVGIHEGVVTAAGFLGAAFTVDLTRPVHRDLVLMRAIQPASPLSTSGPIFTRNGQPWRWKGVTAFKLARLHADGVNIDPFLEAYKGFNVLRVFDYVTWLGTGWEAPTHAQTLAFLNYVAARGWYVELVLLTDDEPGRIAPAISLVRTLAASRPPPPNLVLEIGNEPNTNKHINTSALRSTLKASGFLFSSGDYDDSAKFFGTFGTAHTPRDNEWPRKAHDLLEYYVGGGPSAPTDPAHKVPWVADEPIRPDQAGQPPVGDRASDFLAYFATASILGGGGSFHCETCKYGQLPTADEAAMAAAALAGLNQFPDNAPIAGPYERIDEQGATLRTYRVGAYTVRIRPTDGRIFP